MFNQRDAMFNQRDAMFNQRDAMFNQRDANTPKLFQAGSLYVVDTLS
jgi:hypothetical protein